MKRRHARALLRDVLARPALAQSRSEIRAVGDSAKRSVTLPAKIERVFVGGPPASVLAYVLAPDAMVGWIRQPSPAEKEFLAAPARDLRETGQLTGPRQHGEPRTPARGQARPGARLRLDDGDLCLAGHRGQSQTGIPYALIDGRFAGPARRLCPRPCWA